MLIVFITKLPQKPQLCVHRLTRCCCRYYSIAECFITTELRLLLQLFLQTARSCHSMLINKYIYYQAGTSDTLITGIQFLFAAILCSLCTQKLFVSKMGAYTNKDLFFSLYFTEGGSYLISQTSFKPDTLLPQSPPPNARLQTHAITPSSQRDS